MSKKRELAQQLRFSTRRCRCGGQRLLGQVCVECGMRPRDTEIDTEVVRRRQLVQQVRSTQRNLTPTEGLDINQLLDRASSVIDPFLRALGVLSKGSDQGALDDLQAAAQAIEQLVLDAEVPQPRPFRRIGVIFAEISQRVRDSMYGFLDATGAETPLQAQERGRQAQAHLDEATARLSELRTALADLNLLMSADGDTFVDLLAHRVIQGTDEGILGAERPGIPVVRRIVGADVEPTVGLGLAVLWAATYAQVLFDYDRFCSLASMLYGLLAADSGPFEALANDVEWRDRHSRALTAIVDSASTLQNMLAVAQHDRAAVRSVLLFVQDVYEGACKHFAATILTQTGGKSYAEYMRARQTTPLVHHVRDKAAVAPLAEGLLGPLRNASGHNDYAIRDDCVVLNSGPDELVLTDAQFTDEALFFSESAMALSLAFEIALLQRGLSTQTQQSNSLLSPDQAARFLLASAGLTDITVKITPDQVTISGEGSLTSPMPTVGALLALMPETATRLSITWHGNAGVRHLDVPLELARAHARATPDTIEQELAFATLCSVTTLDDSPFMSRVGFRHLIALRAGAVTKATPAEFGTRFRLLRETATNAGDQHCAEILRLVTRGQRLMSQGDLPEDTVRDAIDELATWERRKVSKVFAE